MKKPALIPALIAVLLSACAAGPDYQRPTVDTPAAFKELGDWKPAEPREPAADRAGVDQGVGQRQLWRRAACRPRADP